MVFTIYHPTAATWYWQLESLEGAVICRSAELYSSEADCLSTIRRTKLSGPGAPMVCRY